MKRALLLLLTACSLRAPRVDVQACSTTAQCDQGSVCFLGECRHHSQALALVVAEVRPPNDSSVGVLQVKGLDLTVAAVQNFTLVAPLQANGAVVQQQDATAATAPVTGAAVTFTQHDPPIPDRVEQVTAQTDPSGQYAAILPQGLWDVLVVPPSPLPPYRPAQPLDTGAPQLQQTLPSANSLVRFNGLAQTPDGGPIEGANLTAVDVSDNALSAPAASQADGGFTLFLPPGASGYFLQFGPPADADAGTPLPSYDRLTAATPLNIDLPPPATLSGTVTDSTGAPVPAARVYARAENMPWTLARSTTAASDGKYTLPLRAGSYVVEAAPSAAVDAPGVSDPADVTLAAASTADFTCPAKVRGFGLITRADGSPVGANYQITATRLADKLVTTRTAFTTATDSAGIWHVVADPGRYRVEIVPTVDSGLPRKIVQIDILTPATPTTAETQLPNIAISPPLLVGGTVQNAAGQPVANATVSFFALDTFSHGVLLGSAPTDVKGHYNVVLPDVAQPGAAH